MINDNKITIIGRIPSLKNSKMAIPMGNRCILLPQKNYKVWHKDASMQLLGKKAIPTPCQLTIDFWFPDKRRTDTINKAESILDLLVDNGILPDDNCIEIPTLLLRYRGIDREQPRAEITWLTLNSNQL